jgi:hypothetical protein
MMRQLRVHRRRTLGFEALEHRRVMAGNVSAYLFPGTGQLNIAGDALANAVEVSGTGVAGQVLITPVANSGTTVNGSAAPVLLNGVTGGLAVNMNQGNDEITVKDFAFNGDGLIDGSQGADKIKLGAWVAYGQPGSGDVSFTGMLRIDEEDTSAADADYIFLGRVTVGNRIDIGSGLGNDYVEFYNARANGVGAGTSDVVWIRGEDGDDIFNLAYVTSLGDVTLSADALATGHDLVSVITSAFHGATYIDVWHGSNTVALNANNFHSTLEIFSETGNDTITLTNSLCSKKITIVSFYQNSNGNDTIRIEGNAISERLWLHSGSGYDGVTIQGNQIATANIWAGGDSDSMVVRYNVFFGHSDFVGDAGYDLLYFSGNLFHSTYAIYLFESIQA